MNTLYQKAFVPLSKLSPSELHISIILYHYSFPQQIATVKIKQEVIAIHTTVHAQYLFNLSKNNSCAISKRSAHERHPSYIHRINLTVQYCRISAMQLPQSMLFPLSHLNLVISAGFKHRKLLSAEKGKTLNDSQVVKWHIIIRQMAWSWL